MATELAPRLADVPGWDERTLVTCVSARPVGGVEVWRIPLAAALAAATGESAQQWAARIEESVARLGLEHTRVGTAVDVRLGEYEWLLPLADDDMCLWQGRPGSVVVRSFSGADHRHTGRAGLVEHVERALVFTDAVMGLARAAGDAATREFGEQPGAVAVTGPVESRWVAFGPVSVVGDRPETLWVSPEEPSTPVRAALLAARASTPVELDTERLLTRTSANPGFLLVHTALMAAARAATEPDCPAQASVRDDGAESLIVGLASYPFVVEKGLATADPGMVLRHLLTVASRCARLGAGGSEPRRHLWQSAAAVLAHGIEALGMRVPSRI